MQTSRNGPPLEPGRHQGFVVAADWNEAGGLHFDVTLMRGGRRGEVVSFELPPGAVPDVCRAFGADVDGLEPVISIVGMPCDLVVDDAGNVTFA